MEVSADLKPVEHQVSPELKIQSYGRSIPSISHPGHNEDAIAHSAQDGFAALFDGMGGQQNGELASRVARTSLVESLRKITTPDLVTAEKQISAALQAASKRIGKEAQGGGSTATVIKFIDGNRKAVIGHVGDSRAYIQRGGRLLGMLTEDDNALSMRYDLDSAARLQIGQRLDAVSSKGDLDALTEQERNLFLHRNEIAQALDGSVVNPHVYPVWLQEGDTIILTSDGIHDNLTQAEIAQISQTTPPERMADALAEAAQVRSTDKTHIRSKADDTSALVITVGSEAKVASPAPAGREHSQIHHEVDLTGGRSFSVHNGDGKRSSVVEVVLPDGKVLKVGRVGDFGLGMEYTTEYIIIDPKEFKETNHKAGYKGLRDGESVPLGRSTDAGKGRFSFGDKVSRVHLEIKRDGPKITITDLGSTNGTKVRL